MIYGNVGDALIEIRQRITAHLHYFLYQTIGIGYGERRFVDKACLSEANADASAEHCVINFLGTNHV